MKKRILFITYEDPFLGVAGDFIGTRTLVKCFESIAADFDLLSFRNIGNKSNNNLLEIYFKNIVFIPFKSRNKFRLVVSKYPAAISNRHRSAFINKMLQMVEDNKYNYIIVNHLKMSYLIDYLDNASAKKIFISHNVEQLLTRTLYEYTKSFFNRLMYYQEYVKTRIYENKFLNKFDIITAVSDKDLSFFTTKYKNAEISLLPPFVFEEIKLNTTKVFSNKIILCGSFFWEPKQENLIRLLDSKKIGLLKANKIELLIVGNAPDKITNYINSRFDFVKMTGFVEDTKIYYKDAKVALVPELLGGGFKLKIAESISEKVPIVAFNVAITDFDMKNGVHFVGVDTFDEMIQESINLFFDPERQVEIANNAYQLFAKKYAFDKIEATVANFFNRT